MACAAAVLVIAATTAVAQEPAVNVLDMSTGRSYPITTPVPITRISIADPEVADVLVVADREVVINAKKTGETDAIVWLQNGLRQHYRVSVHSPTDRMQIILSVKFAEVRRDLLRQLGTSALFRGPHARVGTDVFRSDNAIDPETGDVSIAGTSNFLTILSDLSTDRLLVLLQAEAQKGRAKFLAEPSLMAGNKDTASFLAGGELPIPVAQGSSDPTAPRVTVTYREFGIRLRFVGEIISDSLIKLTVAPEVSSLDFGNAIILSGFRIPAFRTRRMTSTLDVRRDESLIISGLFSSEQERVKTGIPLLMDIPILGQLFSSTRYQQNETELIVVVTPIIVNPLHPRGQDVLKFKPDSTVPAKDALEPRLPDQPRPQRPPPR